MLALKAQRASNILIHLWVNSPQNPSHVVCVGRSLAIAGLDQVTSRFALMALDWDIAGLRSGPLPRNDSQ